MKIDKYLFSLDSIHGVLHSGALVFVSYTDTKEIELRFPNEQDSLAAYEKISKALEAE